MIIKNKLTGETLELTYLEFRKKFTKEIRDVFESCHKTQLINILIILKMITL